MKHIQDRFSITISPKLEIHYLHLHNQKYLLQKSKRLTMIAESWGTTRLAWCALQLLTPHVFIDTTGCAFTFLVAKVLAGCKVGCYVHYPTISTVR
jgi:alpha-1,2-mannosyltransferase